MSKFIQSKTNLPKYFLDKKLDEETFSTEIDNKFPFLAPHAYLEKINWQNSEDPLKKMVWPDEQEAEVKAYEIKDPIGDEPHLAVPNLVHRYPDRVLLLLTNRCQINCRFCFRRELTHHSSPADLDLITNYLSNHPEVKEVIFSGGDPLTLSAKYLTNVYEKLSQVSSLKIFRFHTRIPVVNPEWLDDHYFNFFQKVAAAHQLVVVFHINHSQEIDKKFIESCGRLRKIGAMLLSQTVLLKKVNNDAKILTNLFSNLTNIGVKPYYLHHPDLVSGTHHFRVSIEDGLQLIQQVRNKISGIAMPTYVLDLPGGRGKVPVEALKKVGPKTYQGTNFKNEIVTYLDPAEETNED